MSNNKNAPNGAMSSPFGTTGMFDVIGTERVEAFSEEDIEKMVPALSQVGTPLGTGDGGKSIYAEVAGIRVKIMKA